MFKTLGSALKNRELRKSIIITLLLLLVYRLGCFLPTPGLSSDLYADIAGDDVTGILGLLNAITGSALANASVFALGVTPYINSSIIVQLLAVAIPPLERLSKEGDEGRQKINMITKIVALVLALAQGLGIVLGLGGDYVQPIFGEKLKWLTSTIIILILMAGTCFTMWLGDKITEQGVGNGLSLIIFVGIIATSAQSIVNAIKNIQYSLTYLWELLGFLALVLLVFFLIVFVDLAERKITVQYAKQIKGRKMYGGQASYIPMKINASGVMPIIFASAIITFPSLIMSLFGLDATSGGFAGFWFKYLGTGTVVYSILTCLLILFFAYFYAQIQFNPADVSLNIQQHGGFIPGIRPGKPTTDYLKKVSNRITLFGAIFLAFIALVPSVAFSAVAVGSQGLLNSFTATGMLIVVSVAIEFRDQLEAQLMMKRHKNIL
ncbi:MAG: preprotein translocase subunit SecY [Clostridia bacterium]|nr:preprotein translocase subunit SecY [Clostridia bacterium]